MVKSVESIEIRTDTIFTIKDILNSYLIAIYVEHH